MLATDPDAGLEGILAYSIVSGNTGSAFSVDEATGQLRVAQTSLMDRERAGGFTFTLGVRAQDTSTPSSGRQSTDATVTVTINDVNEPPTVKSGSCSSANNLDVDEESPINTNIGSSPLAPLSLCIDDIDAGASHTYTLLGSKTHSIAAADISSASLASSGDWSISLSTPTTLVVSPGIIVKQGGLDPDQTSYPGRWVAEASLNSVDSSGNNVALDGTSRSTVYMYEIRGTFTANDNLIFGEGLGNGKVTLNAVTGRFQVAVANLDREESPFVFLYTVRVSDNGGLSIDQDIQITINDVNEPPQMPSSLEMVREVTETEPGSLPTFPGTTSASTFLTSDVMVTGSCGVFPVGGTMPLSCQKRAICAQDEEGDTLTYTLDTTGTPFKLVSVTDENGDATGCELVQVRGTMGASNSFSSLDYETQSSWELVVTVQESATSDSFSTTGTITINIVDQNDAPILAQLTRSVGENSVSPTNVGAIITATDQDVADTLTYLLLASGNTADFSSSAGVTPFMVTTAGTPSTRSTQLQLAPLGTGNSIGDATGNVRSYTLNLRITDNDTPGGGVTPLSIDTTIVVSVVEQNDPPVVSVATFSVPENSIPGTVVGTATATDEDVGQTLTFSLIGEGNIDSAFEINAATGQIRVQTTAPLDYETRTSFSVEVQVRDNGAGALTGSTVLLINLIDINELPVVNDATRTVNENVPAGTQVTGGPVTGTDIDAGQTLSYSIVSCTPTCLAADFVVDVVSGIITTSKNLNFERQNTYALTYRATDSHPTGPLTNDCVVNINVLNVNDAPIAQDANVRVLEDVVPGTLLTQVTQSDEDVGTGETFTYTLDTSMDGCRRFVVSDPTSWYHVDRQIETSGKLSMTMGVAANTGVVVKIWLHRELDEAGYLVRVDDKTKELAVLECFEGVPCNKVITSVSFASNGGMVDFANGADGTTFHFWMVVNSNFPLSSGNVVVSFGFGKIVGNSLLVTKSFANSDAWFETNQNFLNQVSLSASIAGTSFNGVCTSSYPAANSANSKFFVDSDSGEISLRPNVGLDYESKNIYSFVVKITDSGALTDNSYVVIRIADMNEPMVFNENCPTNNGVTSCMTVSENSLVTTVVGTHVGVDPDQHVTCSSSRPGFVATVFSDKNYGGNAYEILMLPTNTITSCMDAASTTIGGVGTMNSIQIECGYKYEAFESNDCTGTPVLLGGAAALKSNAGDLQSLKPASSTKLTSLRVSNLLSRSQWSLAPKFLVPVQTLTYAITSGNVGQTFAIDALTGTITLAKSNAVDHEDPVTLGLYDLVLSATDDGSPKRTVSTSILITITDVNEPPTISFTTRTVKENQAPTTRVGEIIAASDPDVASEPFGTLSYSIIEPCANPIAHVCYFPGPFTHSEASDFCTNEKGSMLATSDQAQASLDAGAVFEWAWVNSDGGSLGSSDDQIRKAVSGAISISSQTVDSSQTWGVVCYSMYPGEYADGSAVGSCPFDFGRANDDTCVGGTELGSSIQPSQKACANFCGRFNTKCATHITSTGACTCSTGTITSGCDGCTTTSTCPNSFGSPNLDQCSGEILATSTQVNEAGCAFYCNGFNANCAKLGTTGSVKDQCSCHSGILLEGCNDCIQNPGSQSLPPLSGSTTDVQCKKNTGLIPPPLDYVAVGCTQNSGIEQIPAPSFHVDSDNGQFGFVFFFFFFLVKY